MTRVYILSKSKGHERNRIFLFKVIKVIMCKATSYFECYSILKFTRYRYWSAYNVTPDALTIILVLLYSSKVPSYAAIERNGKSIVYFAF